MTKPEIDVLKQIVYQLETISASVGALEFAARISDSDRDLFRGVAKNAQATTFELLRGMIDDLPDSD